MVNKMLDSNRSVTYYTPMQYKHHVNQSPNNPKKAITMTTKAPVQPKTAEEVKAQLHARGLTVKQWAADNNYPLPEVYKIMSGERKGLYGRGHEIAVTKSRSRNRGHEIAVTKSRSRNRGQAGAKDTTRPE